MKAADLRKLSMEELQAEHVRLLREQLNMRIKQSMDRLPQHHQMKEARRDIARIKTIMRDLDKEKDGGS